MVHNTFLHLKITPAPENNVSGILIPEALTRPPAVLHTGEREYRYRFLPDTMQHEATPLPHAGRWVIYAPLLFSLWAAAFVQAIPNTRKLVLDKAWANRQGHLSRWRWQLGYEQMRLGSDVESPTFCKLLHQMALHEQLPRRTIGEWRRALTANNALFSSHDANNLIHWQDKAAPEIR